MQNTIKIWNDHCMICIISTVNPLKPVSFYTGMLAISNMKCDIKSNYSYTNNPLNRNSI